MAASPYSSAIASPPCMADQIVVLDGRHVREVGSHEELMARRRLYAEIYTLQARSYAAAVL